MRTRGGRAARTAARRAVATFETFTAHFLKSVCFEIGHVASRATLLMRIDSSNHGDVHEAARHPVAAAGLDGDLDLPAAGFDPRDVVCA